MLVVAADIEAVVAMVHERRGIVNDDDDDDAGWMSLSKIDMKKSETGKYGMEVFKNQGQFLYPKQASKCSTRTT